MVKEDEEFSNTNKTMNWPEKVATETKSLNRPNCRCCCCCWCCCCVYCRRRHIYFYHYNYHYLNEEISFWKLQIYLAVVLSLSKRSCFEVLLTNSPVSLIVLQFGVTVCVCVFPLFKYKGNAFCIDSHLRKVKVYKEHLSHENVQRRELFRGSDFLSFSLSNNTLDTR